MTRWRMLFGCCCLVIASYFGYIGYLETRVNTPFDDVKVSDERFDLLSLRLTTTDTLRWLYFRWFNELDWMIQNDSGARIVQACISE